MPQPSRRPRPGSWPRKDRSLGELGLSPEGSGSSGIAIWRDGVGLAAIPALLGLVPLVTGHFEMWMRHGSRLVLDGAPARALGIAALAFGACVHFHFYWGARKDLSPYSQAAQVGAAVVFLAALGYIAYATLRL
jgi:hypothetical protein